MTPQEVLTLLEICDLAKEWPNLKHIHDAAMEKLVKAKLFEKPVEEPEARPSTYIPRRITEGA